VSESIIYKPIGVLRCAFTEKFGVPRQSGMVPAATATIELNQDARFVEAVAELRTFSHVWVIFHFDRIGLHEWRSRVDTPRLGVEGEMGVLSTRSPHRPNPIGMSAVKLDDVVVHDDGRVRIIVSGVDILDETPVLDIKPYIPFADCISGATDGWAVGGYPRYTVTYAEQAKSMFQQASQRSHEISEEFLTQVLSLDPRPVAQRRAIPIDLDNEGRKFAFRIQGIDVHWRIHDAGIMVDQIKQLHSAFASTIG
jgi:tRNA-Thr(GGU) m(6)t(6)A37 methyltransferase TsaA